MATFYGSYPVSGGGGGVPTYVNLAAFPSAVTSGNGALAIALDSDILYISNGTIWEVLADPTISPFAITALTGDVTATGPGSVAATIANLAVTNAKIANTTIDLTTKVTGVLPIANGGTNSNTALSNNRVIQSSGGKLVEASAITASRALASDINGIPVASVTTAAELAFVNGVTSAIQTQLNAKAIGPGVSIDSEIALFSGTGGETLKRATGTGVVHSTSGVYSVSNVSLTSEVTGTLPIGNGGTNSAVALNNNRIMISSGGAISEQSALTASAPMRTTASGLPTTGSLNLATEVTGTLGVTNGGTGTATQFTAGSVVFAGASGVYSQNNASFFWDNSQKTLGIGTATPSASGVSIAGAGGSLMHMGALTTTYSHITLNGATAINSNNFSSSTSDQALYINTPSGNDIIFREANTTLRVIFKTGGNVGINTNNPGAQLQVSANTSSTKGLIVRTAGTSTTNNTEFQNSSGTAYVSIGPDTLSGSSTTSNWFNVTATLPSTLTATTNAINCQVTGAGSSSQIIRLLNADLLAGYTGSSFNSVARFANATAGTGTTLFSAGDVSSFNAGGYANASATTTGTNIGLVGVSFGGNVSYGVLGAAITDKNSASNVGVAGFGLNGGTSPVQVGGYFGLQNTNPTLASSALICDNGATTSNIFLARDNGTAVITVADGGASTFTQTVTVGQLIDSGLTINTAVYSNGSSQLTSVTAGVDGQVLTQVAGVPAWANATASSSMNGNVRASEGGGTVTLTNSDNQTQTWNLSSAETVKLPTTGVLKGDIWVMINPNQQVLTIQSSGANPIIKSWGSRVVLQANVATPTAAADWTVLEHVILQGRVWTDYTPTYSTGTGISQTFFARWIRPQINLVQIEINTKFSGTNAGGAGSFTFTGPSFLQYNSTDYPDGTDANLGGVKLAGSQNNNNGYVDLVFGSNPDNTFLIYYNTSLDVWAVFPWSGFVANDRIMASFAFKSSTLSES